MSDSAVDDRFWDAAPCGFLRLNRAGVIQAVNATMLRWLGLTASMVVVSRRFIELLTPGGQMYHDAVFMPQLLIAGEVSEVSFELRQENGRSLSVFCTARLLRHNAAEYIYMTLIDASERRRYERDLLTANRALQGMIEERNRMLGTVVHDLRTPLGGIMGLAQLVADDPENDQSPEYLSLIQSTGTSMLNLIDDLLDVSSAEDKLLRMKPTLADLRVVVRQAIAVMAPSAEEKGCALTHYFPAEDIYCRYDAARILQALSNLLSNALKFSPRDTTVEVFIEMDQQQAIIGIADRGPGIPPEEVEHLFEPFATGRARPTGGERSTGLGLSIVHRIASAHGGSITATPRSGGGTTFCLQLPLSYG